MGILDNLFGLKTKYVDEKPEETQKPANNQKQGAFYLSPDDAKTVGSMEYMRKSKTVKRTFAKTKTSPNTPDLIKQISSIEGKTLTNDQMSSSSNPAVNSETLSTVENGKVEAEPRRADSTLDEFRKMARDIRKIRY